MSLIILQGEIPITETEDVRHLWVQCHHRQRIGTPRELLARLIEMVEIKMRVAETMHELARLQAGDLRHHHGEKRIGGDVEGHAQKDVRRALIELTRQSSLGDREL